MIDKLVNVNLKFKIHLRWATSLSYGNFILLSQSGMSQQVIRSTPQGVLVRNVLIKDQILSDRNHSSMNLFKISALAGLA